MDIHDKEDFIRPEPVGNRCHIINFEVQMKMLITLYETNVRISRINKLKMEDLILISDTCIEILVAKIEFTPQFGGKEFD